MSARDLPSRSCSSRCPVCSDYELSGMFICEHSLHLHTLVAWRQIRKKPKDICVAWFVIWRRWPSLRRWTVELWTHAHTVHTRYTCYKSTLPLMFFQTLGRDNGCCAQCFLLIIPVNGARSAVTSNTTASDALTSPPAVTPSFHTMWILSAGKCTVKATITSPSSWVPLIYVCGLFFLGWPRDLRPIR